VVVLLLIADRDEDGGCCDTVDEGTEVQSFIVLLESLHIANIAALNKKSI
jgi:hypothetical protein